MKKISNEYSNCVTGIEGMLIEEAYQTSHYYFDKNTFGDVIAIRNDFEA